eukprot:3798909-Pleurochrysis_carterae.AAC.1
MAGPRTGRFSRSIRAIAGVDAACSAERLASPIRNSLPIHVLRGEGVMQDRGRPRWLLTRSRRNNVEGRKPR